MSKKKKQRKPKIDRVSNYAKAVVAGEVITGRWVRLACERHLRDMAAVEAGESSMKFDVGLAQHAIDFFWKFLRLAEGEFADVPFTLSPHQEFVVGSLFGWLKADKYRRFRHAYIEEGKGDGKSPMAAGMAIYGLIMDCEEGAEIYCAAVTRDQAGICFRDVKNMAERSLFADRLIISEHNIAYPATRSFIRPVSAQARSLDGKRVFMSILDEVHEHASPLVIDKMTAGNKGRKQPLNIRITNSGYDRTSICWYEHEYSRQVLEGLHRDDDWFAYVCQLDLCDKCHSEGKASPQDECPNCDHWWEERNWKKANPNLGVSIGYDYLRSEVNKALKLPSKALTVKRLNFCIWTEQAHHWVSLDSWDQCALDIDLDRLEGRDCYAGLDLSDTKDTTSLVLIFPPTDKESDDPLERTVFVLPFIWIPEDMTDRTEQERQRFRAWESQGFVRFTPGNYIDYEFIMATLDEWQNRCRIIGLAFDRFGSSRITTELCDQHNFTLDAKEAEMYQKPLLQPWGQGQLSMSPPTKEVATMLLAKSISHDGNPAMRWMMGNVVVEQDGAGNIKPHKGKSTEKIDAPVAMIEAVGLYYKHMGGDMESVYETRGVRSI